MDSYFSVLNLSFMENYHLSIHMAFWKESMINRLSNLINRNRSAAKISQILCSNIYAYCLMVEARTHDGLLELSGVRVGGTG